MILVFLHRPNGGRWPETRELWLEALYQTRTGQRLLTIIGGLDEDFVVENLMPRGEDSDSADEAWMERRLVEVDPRLVLALSAAGSRILPRIWSGPLICTRHPNARYLVDGDPLFHAIRRLIKAPNFSRRVFMNRDRSNVITEVDVDKA